MLLVNTLEIVGANTDMNNLITINAATNKRHLNNANATLVVRYLKLVGGDVSSPVVMVAPYILIETLVN